LHRFFSRSLFGRDFVIVDRALDRPYLWLRRKHRALFHTYPEAVLMGMATSTDPLAGMAAAAHVWLDKKCSRDKEFKRRLQWMERQDREHRKIMRKWAKLLKKKR
jgi:hypothetical protein